MVANTNSNAGSAKGSNTMATPTNSSASRPATTPARSAAAIEDKPRAATAAQTKVDAAKAEQQKGKLAAIGRAMEAIEKAYGKGSIMKLDGDSLAPIPSIPTGALSLGHRARGRGFRLRFP